MGQIQVGFCLVSLFCLHHGDSIGAAEQEKYLNVVCPTTLQGPGQTRQSPGASFGWTPSPPRYMPTPPSCSRSSSARRLPS